MSNNLAPEKAPAPLLSRVPPEESAWKRYSPHGEAPLSFAGSIALHTLGLGGALLLIIYIASVFSKSTQSLPVEPVRLDLGGGGGNKQGNGDASGAGNGAEPQERVDEPPQPGINDATPRLTLNPVEQATIQQKFDTDATRYINDNPTEQKKAFASLDENLRRKLSDGLSPGKGRGGSGSGGGKDMGKGSGDGPGTGDGKATLNKRERRMLRWHMKFEARNGQEYLAQLRGLGAILAFPVSEGASPTYKVVHDLRPGHAKLQDDDLSKIQRIYWIDDKPNSVRDILGALGLRIPPPSRFVAFMPQSLEEQLYVLEKNYVEKVLGKSPFNEDLVEETVFRAVRTPKGYRAELISVATKQ